MFDLLENRRLLSSSLVGGQLLVTGTPNADSILIALASAGVKVTLNGVVEGTYLGVTSLLVQAGNGADTIDSHTVAQRTTVYGGAGNDTITTGSGADYVDAGTGNDTAQGNGGFNIFSYTGRSENIDGSITTKPRPNAQAIYGLPPVVGAATLDLAGNADEHDTFNNFMQLNGGKGNDLLAVVLGIPGTGEGYGNQVFTPVLAGSGGDDELTVQGNDFIHLEVLGSFEPLVYGGDGDDVLNFFGMSGAKLYGQTGDDTLNVPSGDVHIVALADGGSGTDTQIVMSPGSRIGSYVTHMAPGFENARLFDAIGFTGSAGADSIMAWRGSGVIDGAGGNDTIILFEADDRSATGGAGNDTLVGDSSDDLLYGNEGNDWLFGNDGYDTLYGGTGNDRLEGGKSNDTLVGEIGNDTLYGGYGNDSIIGGSGVDRLYGGPGTDLLYARDGERDYVFGDDGVDKAQLDSAEELVDSIEVVLP